MAVRARVSLMAALLAGCATAGTSGNSATPAVDSTAPAAQAAPSTDVYLFRFGQGGRRGSVFNITNRRGYDNQPSWVSNDRLVYTMQQLDGQTDIAHIDFLTSRAGVLFSTRESEYSPTLTPDGKALSVVRVELDSTQRLWRLPLQGGGPEVILPEVQPVGYFAWMDSTTLALFVLGSPNSLRIADTRTGTATAAATAIGRSLQRVPGKRRASFVQRAAGRWVLRTVGPTPGANGVFVVDSVAVLPDSAEYVVWKSERELYTAAGSRIFRLRLPDVEWSVVADLADDGVRGISRLALSPDGLRLALVADDAVPD
jgi:Tol biopolymer transport system component